MRRMWSGIRGLGAADSLRWVCTLAVLVCTVLFAGWSRHWPLVGDASLMHYVAFLMDRGLVAYRDIIDVNLPGTYGMEWAVIHLLGDGAVAWRMYDLLLGCAAMGAMAAIAWPVDRLAGVFAGGLFFLLHGRDGIAELGQRDLSMTVALLLAAALLLLSVRRHKLYLLPVGGILTGFAVTVKPTAILFWVTMLLCVGAGGDRPRWGRWWSWATGLGAMSVAPVVAGLVLYRAHALAAFWATATGLIPYHNTLLRFPARYFMSHMVPSTLVPLSLTALLVLGLRSRSRPKQRIFSIEERVLLAGVVCGALSFFLQRKALSYHRYPMNAFLILLASVVLFRAIRSVNESGTVRVVAMAGTIAGALVLAPQCLVRAHELSSSPNDLSILLQRDLTALGGNALDGRVQCIDFTGGCTATLYRMKLVQSTGFLYDCYAYGPDGNRVVESYRDAFGKALLKQPPAVLIVTNQNCGRADSFDKLSRWPALASWIDRDYVLAREVTPPDMVRWARQTAAPHRYRVYLRR